MTTAPFARLTWITRTAESSNDGGSSSANSVKAKKIAWKLQRESPQNECTVSLLSSGGSMLGTILIVLLVLLLIGALPSWGYSRSWGYYPSGGLGLIVIIVLILLLLGRI